MNSPYITIYQAVSGWKAVMMWWNNENDWGSFWEPWQTGFGAYATPEEAASEARSWAAAEEVEFIWPKGISHDST